MCNLMTLEVAALYPKGAGLGQYIFISDIRDACECCSFNQDSQFGVSQPRIHTRS